MEKLIDIIINFAVVLWNRISHRSMKVSMQNAQFVNITLKELLAVSGADRAIVYQFHNGVKSLLGVPFYYYSVTHEQVSDRAGVYPIAGRLQRIPVTTASFAVEQALKNNFRYRDVTEIEDAVTRSQCLEFGLKSLVLAPLYSNNGMAIGMVGLGWVHHQAPDFNEWSESSDGAYDFFTSNVKHIADLL